MTYEEAKAAFGALFEGRMEAEEARALLVDMYERGETVDEIVAAAEVMRKHAVKLPVSDDLARKLIDNCGTGGDGSGTFNISTTVSLLLAAAGCFVAKHGNRSITSRSGSADMLEALGICLDLTPDKQVKMLEETGFVFMFAVHHHPAMKFVMPVRKSIPHRTIFNILGPLTNPAGARRQLLGVFSADYVPMLAEALQRLGSERATVISSRDGLDEISIAAETAAADLREGVITSYTVTPEDAGLSVASLRAVAGGDAQQNARTARAILAGEEHGPRRDIVLLNAAAALVVDGKAEDLKEAAALAAETIDSGAAAKKLEQIVELSNRL